MNKTNILDFPEKTDWLPIVSDYVVTYRDGDNFKAVKLTAESIAEIPEMFYSLEKTCKNIISIVLVK